MHFLDSLDAEITPPPSRSPPSDPPPTRGRITSPPSLPPPPYAAVRSFLPPSASVDATDSTIAPRCPKPVTDARGDPRASVGAAVLHIQLFRTPCAAPNAVIRPSRLGQHASAAWGSVWDGTSAGRGSGTLWRHGFDSASSVKGFDYASS
ncbi:hypothetical protein HYPSUDRAFT_205165 [Hypholoma sublateritium FD-334 SS-4]|uniref:Uncharacterized protein n=1 Tax=Hypholoma sublateritium (strain FD-334 SS-4) TaxID=945553 RepID=A0A0D2NPC7_HYPSF|nr:hypothetical protein HYPSUDRAFT_205165 [Hypholoma sublateritium FD-334 SS-4]